MFTFYFVPKHIAVGVVSSNEGNGVTDRIRFHDVCPSTVIGAKLWRVGRFSWHSNDGHRHSCGRISCWSAPIACPNL